MNYVIKDPAEMGIYVQTRNIKPIAAVKETVGADVICNFQLFTIATREANFVLKADGKIIGWDGANYWGFGWNKGDKTFSCDYAKNMAKYENFAGCIPVVRDGKVIKLQSGVDYPTALGGRRGRTCIGLKADGSIVIYCWADGTSGACTMDEIGQKMLDLGCVNAINFDGGGSTQLICPDGKVTTPRAIYNFLWFKENPPAADAAPPFDKGGKDEECPYPEPTRNIRFGMSGEDVKWVQWQLKRHGADLGNFGPNHDGIDGDFGATGKRELIAFQKKAFPSTPGEWDGVAGAKTREELKK